LNRAKEDLTMTAIARRPLLAALLALPALPAAAAIDAVKASSFIQATGSELVAAINSGAAVARRREQVAAVLRRAVDIEGAGRFILGRFWRQATPAEQAEYAKLFEETIILNLAARFGEYQGVKFTLGRAQPNADQDVMVSTTIERPNSPAFVLDWRVAEIGGQPRIVDMIAEGTSLRLTQRSEYASVIQRNNGQVSALLAAMRDQITRMKAQQ
jgi:phospholipid transport system substrate-binding protein